MRSLRTSSLYPHGDQLVDICFETAAPILEILKQCNGFISLSKKNAHVYEIFLGTELF